MENNNRGNGVGIFYGVIGVATLVITIIGATFAYFSAQTNSADNAINAGSTAIQDLSLNDDNSLYATNLIPVDESNAKFPDFVGYEKCKDLNNNEICSMYTFTVTNPNQTAQRVYFYLETKLNTFTNLHYSVFRGKPGDGTYDVDGDLVSPTTDSSGIINAYNVAPNSLVVKDASFPSVASGAAKATREEWANLSQVIPAGGSTQYTIVVWLHETGSGQNEDAGQSMAAGVRITTAKEDASGNLSGGVTAVLSSSAA